ncbi:hypothetical protein [Escherichia sp. E4736]
MVFNINVNDYRLIISIASRRSGGEFTGIYKEYDKIDTKTVMLE